jgi:ketosteroid isomerase-like protein
MRPATKVVQEMYDAFARDDVPTVTALFDPRIRWITPPTLPWSRGTYTGPDEVVEYFQSFGEALADAAVEPHELVDCGDRVVALGQERARVRATGQCFCVPFAHVIRVHQERVIELRGHVDTAAIAAAFTLPAT